MRTYEFVSDYQDIFEYHGNIEIQRIRKMAGKIVRRDWIIFDSVDEAMAYFNTNCGELVGSCANGFEK